MIGSVHGCVSCPVVVRPWESEPLSHPQHPLPSHPHSQSQAYTFSHRSSSVHPMPQNVNPDDEKGRVSLSPPRHVSAEIHHPPSQPLIETGTERSKSRTPEKTGSANGSPQKTRSAAPSPQRVLSVFRSQQAVSEQYEQLLGPQNLDIVNVDSSSQNVAGHQSPVHADTKSTEFDQGLHSIESQVREFELDSPPTDKEKQHLINAGKNGSRSSNVKENILKDGTLRSRSPSPQLPDSSGIGSAQFQRTSFSPTPLPSIQDRSRMLTGRELSRDLSQVSLVSSLRPSKVLSSVSSLKLKPLKKSSFLPPRPSVSLKKEKKQTQGVRKKKAGATGELESDFSGKKKREGKGAQDLQESQLTSAITEEELPHKESVPRNTDSAAKQFINVSESNAERKMDSSSHRPIGQSTPHPSQDAPTPQSMNSSILSVGQSAAAPEADALTTAAAAGDLKKVRALLAEGVSVNAINTFGRTAVQVMSVNNTDLAEVLLKAGANPNMQDKGRRAATSTLRTIAHDVADSGNTDMLRCLLRHGADVNLQDRWGNTPLHLAAKGGHLAAVRLLRRGTSLDQPNLQGKTPIMLLEESRDSAIREWVAMKKSTVSRLQTLCVLVVRRRLGPDRLRLWKKQAMTDVKLQRQVLLQNQGSRPHPHASTSTSTILSSQHSTVSRSLMARGRSNNSNGHPLLPGMSTGKQMTDFLTLRDLIPRRLSTGENTSLEVHNTSSGQSNDDVSIVAGAQATSSLASETGSLFETNLSSIETSQSADDVSLPSFDHSL